MISWNSGAKSVRKPVRTSTAKILFRGLRTRNWKSEDSDQIPYSFGTFDRRRRDKADAQSSILFLMLRLTSCQVHER